MILVKPDSMLWGMNPTITRSRWEQASMQERHTFLMGLLYLCSIILMANSCRLFVKNALQSHKTPLHIQRDGQFRLGNPVICFT